MALFDPGRSAGKTGGGGFETDAVEAEIFGAGVDIWNAPDVAAFSPTTQPHAEGSDGWTYWKQLKITMKPRRPNKSHPGDGGQYEQALR